MVAATHPPRNGFVRFARKVYNPVGFSKGYNFILWFVLSGAMLGFAAARLEYIDFYGRVCNPDRSKKSLAAPGECFALSETLYGASFILHLACILPGSILALVQFVPVVRHRAILLHRVNGYLVILLAVPGAVGGLIILRRTFGGGLNTQAVGGLFGIAFIVALALAYINIKRLQIDQHRAWMLRAWVWGGCIITIRLLFFIMFNVVPLTGTYYETQSCEKIAWLLNNSENNTVLAYPECERFFSGLNPDQHVSVKAQFLEGTLPEKAAVMDMVFGVCMWLGFAIHAVAVEIYLRLTPAEAERLRKISAQRQFAARRKTPDAAELSLDSLSDAGRQNPVTPTDQ